MSRWSRAVGVGFWFGIVAEGDLAGIPAVHKVIYSTRILGANGTRHVLAK